MRPAVKRLVACDSVGGAVGEAESALHTGVEVVGIDLEIHVRLLPGGRGSVAGGINSRFVRSAIWAATGSGSVGWGGSSAQTVPTPMLAMNAPSVIVSTCAAP